MDTLIPFFPFNEFDEVRMYQYGTLPHWRQDGCTYFVTFRLADSMPQSVLVALQEERDSWLRSRGIDPKQKEWQQSLARLPKSEQREFEKLTKSSPTQGNWEPSKSIFETIRQKQD